MADRQLPGGASGPGHPDHDPERIVALLDRDLPEADRVAAEALVTDCPSCAALHMDLLALTRATIDVPIPRRPRDFTLSPETAAMLVDATLREPVRAGSRLGHEMPETRARHTTHDRLLIANLVGRSVDEAERARAEEMLAACRDCEQLYDDLVALSAATSALPAPARPRDFTLTAADAERLRVRGWRRLLGAIGSSRDAFSRPLALGLTTLGVAGLLVGTIPAAFSGMASSPAMSAIGNDAGDAAGGIVTDPETLSSQASGEQPPAGTESGPAAAAAPAAPSAAPSAAAEALPPPSDAGSERLEPDKAFVGGESSPLAGEPDGDDLYRTSETDTGPISRSALIALAGLLLLVGLGLFALRWTARRLGDG